MVFNEIVANKAEPLVWEKLATDRFMSLTHWPYS
jgi:hypothetical protein